MKYRNLGKSGIKLSEIGLGGWLTFGNVANEQTGRELIDTAFDQWDSDAGGGQGLQPFASMVAVVDVDDLLEPMPQHSWGAQSLDRLPTTLNRASQLDTGSNGIQQRGTSPTVGQHSLDTGGYSN